MKNDSVREELQSKITTRPESGRLIPAAEEAVAAATVSASTIPENMPAVRRSGTADLSSKNTSPTLADFRHLNPGLPEWRLKLQNSVRLRTGRGSADEATSPAPPALSISSPSLIRGSSALKPAPAGQPFEKEDLDPKILNALKRIEISRRTYLGSEKAREGIRVAKAASKRFPFDVVSRSDELPAQPVQGPPVTPNRPKLAAPLKIEKGKYDTNKLTPIPEAEYLEKVETVAASPAKPLKENWSTRIEIRENVNAEAAPIPAPESAVEAEPAIETIDDLAPMAMRFNAGLFDLIVGGFLAFILLSPYFALSEGWFSISGLLLFASVLTVVMFVYLTAATAFFGQTIGMRLFGLELLDYESNEVASLHQSAVNAAVYLLSVLLIGLGFLPALFNEENRAAHDLAAGTILVRTV